MTVVFSLVERRKLSCLYSERRKPGQKWGHFVPEIAVLGLFLGSILVRTARFLVPTLMVFVPLRDFSGLQGLTSVPPDPNWRDTLLFL